MLLKVQLLFVVVSLMLAGCTAAPLRAQPVAMDVRAVVNSRAELDGQVVTIDGFLSRLGPFLFLSQGTIRPPDKLGPNGEEYWCYGIPETSRIWIRIADVSAPSGASNLAMTSMPNDVGSGRRVILQGVFRNRTEPGDFEDFNMLQITGRDLAQTSAGPVTRAEIVRFLSDRCDVAAFTTDRR